MQRLPGGPTEISRARFVSMFNVFIIWLIKKKSLGKFLLKLNKMDTFRKYFDLTWPKLREIQKIPVAIE